jgi:hypothetical protein
MAKKVLLIALLTALSRPAGAQESLSLHVLSSRIVTQSIQGRSNCGFWTQNGYTWGSCSGGSAQEKWSVNAVETDTMRYLLSCRANLFHKCFTLNVGDTYQAEPCGGSMCVHLVYGKHSKAAIIRYAIVETVGRPQPQPPPAQEPPLSKEAPPSIEAPKSAGANSGFPARWKSMMSGTIRTLRFEGEYIYGETVLSEAAVKAGAFALMDVKKDGDKYVGKVNGRLVRQDGGASCSATRPIELTLVTPDRIEGRSFYPPLNAKIDWNTCTYALPANWQPFTWIPVR